MKYRLPLLLTLAAIAVAALTAAGPVAARSNATAQKVTVTMTDFKFKLSKSSVNTGPVTFTVVNKGKSIHNFVLPGVKSSPFLAPGKSKTYTVIFKKGGKFHYLCTVPRHAELGMTGDLMVKAV